MEADIQKLKDRIESLEQELEYYRSKKEELQRLAVVVTDSNDAITLQDLAGNITAWNKGAGLIYGYTAAEALQMNVFQLVPANKIGEMHDFFKKVRQGEKIDSFETQRRTKDGRVLDIWLTVTQLTDQNGNLKAIATTERDISERNRFIRQLAEMSVKDELTGLYNRRGFIVFAEKFLQQIRHRGGTASLIYIDIDNLKTINDSLGHAMGDKAIVSFAGIMNNTFRSTDVIARIGGDEFVVVTEIEEDGQDAGKLVQRLKENVVKANQGYMDFYLSVSIGKAIQKGHAVALEGLMKQADQEMYREKQLKKIKEVMPAGM